MNPSAKRIHADIASVRKNLPSCGIFCTQDDTDTNKGCFLFVLISWPIFFFHKPSLMISLIPCISSIPLFCFLHLVHALIQGPSDTPYEFGLFFFTLTFPQDYPFSSPKAEIRTTSKGTVRFNPNLYSNGKVCLSILGTWEGPSWTASLSLETVLLSIQSLLGESPMQNEPGTMRRSLPFCSHPFGITFLFSTRNHIASCIHTLTRHILTSSLTHIHIHNHALTHTICFKHEKHHVFK